MVQAHHAGVEAPVIPSQVHLQNVSTPQHFAAAFTVNKIVAAASAEINKQYRNAELTDCATAEGFQGKGYMRSLLLELERNLRTQGITCLYTIARAESFGMNKAFHDLGFAYSGRMTNNCFIFSGLEDMNVWYKF